MYFNIIWITAGYLLGIITSDYIPYFSLLIFAVSLFILLILRGFIKKYSVRRYLIFIAAFLLGAANYMLASNIDFTDSAAYLDRYITVRGRINELPTSYNTSEDKPPQYYYIIDLREISYHGETIKTRDRIRISSSEKYNYGDTITAEGFLEEFADKMNSNSSDTQTYYKTRGIFFRMSALKTSEWNTKYFPVSLRALTNKLADSTSAFIDVHYSDRAGAILKAVLIGDKTQFDEEYNKILDESGAKRLLYTPFLHIIIINMIMAALFAILPVNNRVRDFLLCSILVIYILINGTSPTFVKLPLIMLLTIHRRRAAGNEYFPAILAGAILIIALFEPMCLFDGGFILSVSCTILIHIFLPRLQRYMTFIRNAAIRRILAVSLILTVGTLPLSMYFFGGSAAYTILCTLFFVPLILALLTVSPIVFLMTSVLGGAPIFAETQALILLLMDKIPRLIHSLPFSFLRAGRASITSFETTPLLSS